MEVRTVEPSGDVNRDAVLYGVAWAGNALTFGFPTSPAQFTGYSNGEPFDNFGVLNPQQQSVARSILAALSSFTNLVFSELTGGAEGSAVLRFGRTDDTATAAGYYPSPGEKGGDTWYNNSGGRFDSPVPGNYAYFGFLHEIGHAVGLMHPHESTPPPTPDGDWMANTVMTYRSTIGGGLGYTNETWGYAQSYMVEDIGALQYMYGANFAYNSGDTQYRWDPATGQMFVNGTGQGIPGANRIFMTVWDGGGVDTYDLSNYNVSTATIDLRPGEWSLFSIGQAADLGGGNRPPGNVANATQYNGDPRSLIENAIGTSGDDVIRGNAAANALSGGLGRDTLYGGDGNDILRGGSSADILHGEGGNDTLYYDGEDLLYGGDGNDVLYFGAAMPANATAFGGAGTDAFVLQGNYAMALGSGNLNGAEYLSLQSGSVTRWGDTAGNLYSYNLTMHEANAAPGQQLVVNGQSLLAGENFTFNGSVESDGGRYLVYGGRGVDNFTGGSGTDVFYFEGARWGAGDVINGGPGTDAVVISLGHGLNHVEFGEGQLIGIEAISVNNRFASDPSQIPSYELVIRNGNVIPGGSLIVNGSSLPAGQTLSVDASLVTGGRMTLYGGAANDVLVGGAQADSFYAAGGSDTLRGGAGADVFQFFAAADSAPGGADRILDFAPGTDKLDLQLIDAIAGTAPDDAFSFIGGAAFSGTAGELRATFDGANGQWIVEADIDGVGGADLVILLNGSAANPITATDFVL